MLADYSIFRQQRSRFESTPKVYWYLINRLPLAATLIRILDFGKYKVSENPDGTLTVDNQSGLVLKVWLHHKSEDQLVSYLEGAYNAWWTTGIHGRAAVWLRFRPMKIEGRPVMENEFRGFIKFANPVVELVARIVNFFVQRLAEKEIQQSQNAGRKLAELLAKDPAKVYAAMKKSREISPQDLKEFQETFLRSKASMGIPDSPSRRLRRGRQFRGKKPRTTGTAVPFTWRGLAPSLRT
ncbi:MAG: hypothetical protein ACE5IM_03785 [Nitrospinota bacterium]